MKALGLEIRVEARQEGGPFIGQAEGGEGFAFGELLVEVEGFQVVAEDAQDLLAQRGRVVEHLDRDLALAVPDGEGEHFAEDQPGIALNDPTVHQAEQASGHAAGIRSPHAIDQPLQVGREDGVGGKFGVHGAPEFRDVDHADVVQVSQHDAQAGHEIRDARRFTRRDQHAVDFLEDLQDLLGDIADVDDAVIGEEGGVFGQVLPEIGVVHQLLHRGLMVDAGVIGVFDLLADGLGEVAVERIVGHRVLSVPSGARNGRSGVTGEIAQAGGEDMDDADGDLGAFGYQLVEGALVEAEEAGRLDGGDGSHARARDRAGPSRRRPGARRGS